MVLFVIGLLLTGLWAAAVWYYLDVQVGLENVMALLPSEVGLLVLAAVAPAALVWALLFGIWLAGRLRRLHTSVEMATFAMRSAVGERPKGGPRPIDRLKAPRLDERQPPTAEAKADETAPAAGGKSQGGGESS